MTKFKKNRLLFVPLLIGAIIIIAGCKKNENTQDNGNGITEKPGKIPGMGDMAGVPGGSQYALPPGVSLKGNIVGNEDPNGNCVVDGSGESVMILLTLQRDSIGGTPLTVEFPAGLVITSALETYQHGILIERVLVTLPPKQSSSDAITCKVSLLLQCVNANKNPSDIFATYTFGPITNSPLIKDLIKRLSTKKTTYSDYNQDGDKWRTCSESIKAAVWNLTDGDGLTEDDLEFIRSLPNK